ncbi:hypothetical protein LCGC14_2549740 [marine sediment metagenome]|uniref:Uncharacterized protein n=1 Tax=marine sediment metagenome TaxID=412755 RepID=A0A0F9BB35_9ZZZZ
MKDKVREEVKEPKVTLKEIREFVSYDYDSVPARYLKVLLKLYDNKQKKKTGGNWAFKDFKVRGGFDPPMDIGRDWGAAQTADTPAYDGEAINEEDEEATGNIDTEGF